MHEPEMNRAVNQNVSVQRTDIVSLIGECAEKALLEEVYTTPKPGLVDLHDTGAHRDMDVYTFEKSARVLAPYFGEMAAVGYLEDGPPERVFREIRRVGIMAEKAMFRVTGGVNTHKGAVFTLGILSAAAGYYFRENGDFETLQILRTAEKMTYSVLEKEFQSMKMRKPETAGERLYKLYGERGVRGEAQKGFPVISRCGYPMMKNCFTAGEERNRTYLNVLLYIMTELDDTNILARGTRNDLRWLKRESAAVLKEGGAFSQAGYRRIVHMNEECIRRNLSPGGAADMLAAVIFLYRLETELSWRQSGRKS